MTRKDYILLADVLNKAYRTNGEVCSKCAEIIAIELCDSLKADNPRFDSQHFLAVVRGDKALMSRPSRKVAA